MAAAAQFPQAALSSARALGSRPLVGSSRMYRILAPEQAAGQAELLGHALGECPHGFVSARQVEESSACRASSSRYSALQLDDVAQEIPAVR